nr:hypothetical protein [Tanacetum cinerariifolium]
MFDNRSSDEENSLTNDRFKKGEGYHVVPPPLTGNYMPGLSFTGLDDSIYKFKISETVTSLTKDEKDPLETSTAFVEKTKEVRNSAPLIQDWDTDSDNDSVFRPTHIPAKVDIVKAVSVVKGNEVTAVKSSAGCVLRPRGHPQQALKNKEIVDSECSKHMRWNKAYLVDYQEINDRGKFKGKADEGFLVGYSVTSKAFKVFNTKTRKVKENLHVRFLENKPNVVGTGLPQDTNGNAGTQDNVDARKEVSDQHYIILLLWSSISSTFKSSDDKAAYDKPKDDIGSKTVEKPVNKEDQAYKDELNSLMSQEKEASDAVVNAASTLGTFSAGEPSSPHPDAFIPANTLLHFKVWVQRLTSTTWNLLLFSVLFPHKVHIDHPKDQILGDPKSAVQTRGVAKKSFGAYAFISYIHKQKRTNHKDYKNCLFACFLSQMEPKKVAQALDDESWVEAMQEELLQFHLQNKKDERGIVVRSKARLVAQGHEQEEGIDYDEVFAPVARIEAITIFLAFASFIGFIVYQMDVKSAFLYGTIEEKVYVSQPPGFIDPQFPNKVYKVEKALYGLHQAPRAWNETLSTFMLLNRYRREIIDKTLLIKKDKDDIMLVWVFQMSSMGELTFFLGLQVKQSEEGIFISQDKYVAEILKRFQVTPKLSHLHVVKQIFRKSTTGEYLAAANCCGQVLWIQNQILDYGFNFMNTKIYIDNESTICIVKNPVYHSKTKHIEIRHHFIRDSYEKKLIQVLKIHTNDNVADSLTKAFDVSRFNFLKANNGMLNL